jgi:hypothetical protein
MYEPALLPVVETDLAWLYRTSRVAKNHMILIEKNTEPSPLF